VSKIKLYILGWVTLIIFPIPAYFAAHYLKDVQWESFIQLDKITPIPILYGLEFGIIYAFIASVILKAPVFKSIPLGIEQLIKGLKINFIDAIFLSLCAGIGEELLFRSGMQTFFGVWITSFVFVAIHGYFSLVNIKKSLYGLVVLPFIILISLGYEHFGLWFSIAAHFSYDLVLFVAMIAEKDD
jgi:membrane protease YdiL (CAAX protease family)